MHNLFTNKGGFIKNRLYKLFGFSNVNSEQNNDEKKVSKEEKLLNKLNKIKDWLKNIFKKKKENKNKHKHKKHDK